MFLIARYGAWWLAGRSPDRRQLLLGEAAVLHPHADLAFQTNVPDRELYLNPALVALLVGRSQERVVYRNSLTAAFLLLTASACEAESGLASYYGGRGHRG